TRCRVADPNHVAAALPERGEIELRVVRERSPSAADEARPTCKNGVTGCRVEDKESRSGRCARQRDGKLRIGRTVAGLIDANVRGLVGERNERQRRQESVKGRGTNRDIV